MRIDSAYQQLRKKRGGRRENTRRKREHDEIKTIDAKDFPAGKKVNVTTSEDSKLLDEMDATSTDEEYAKLLQEIQSSSSELGDYEDSVSEDVMTGVLKSFQIPEVRATPATTTK